MDTSKIILFEGDILHEAWLVPGTSVVCPTSGCLSDTVLDEKKPFAPNNGFSDPNYPLSRFPAPLKLA